MKQTLLTSFENEKVIWLGLDLDKIHLKVIIVLTDEKVNKKVCLHFFQLSFIF